MYRGPQLGTTVQDHSAALLLPVRALPLPIRASNLEQATFRSLTQSTTN